MKLPSELQQGPVVDAGWIWMVYDGTRLMTVIIMGMDQYVLIPFLVG